MTAGNKKTGLGRGVSALIPDLDSMDDNAGTYFMCDIEDIIPNKFQPRNAFPEEELEKLTKSIAEQGILQPLLVRKFDDSYELIAGERRLRAAKRAELAHVPVLVRDLSDEQMLEVSIIENIQRQNLNPLEEAEAYYRLIDEFNYTQAMVAKRIGKDRSTISNFIRLRGLPEIIKQSLIKNEISMGHARALLGTGNKENQIQAWKIVIARHLSVRATEQLVQKIKAQAKNAPCSDESPDKSQAQDKNYINQICSDLSRIINSKVSIKTQGEHGNKGSLEIKFTTKEEFQRIILLLSNLK